MLITIYDYNLPILKSLKPAPPRRPHNIPGDIIVSVIECA